AVRVAVVVADEAEGRAGRAGDVVVQAGLDRELGVAGKAGEAAIVLIDADRQPRRAPTLLDADLADEIRHVVVVVRVVFQRGYGEEAVRAREIVLDQLALVLRIAERVVGEAGAVGLAADEVGVVEGRLRVTGEEAAERQPRLVEDAVAVLAVIGLGQFALHADVAAQRAVLGLRAGVEVDAGAGPVGEGVAAGAGPAGPARRVAEIVGAGGADLVIDVAGDAQAGLGAGDVEEAGAVDVADADIFDGLGLGDDDRVGRPGAGDGKRRNREAEDKAVDVHCL